MGAPIKDFCKRGHNMSLSRKFRPNGDSYCYECKKLRTKTARAAHPERHREYYKTSSRKRLYGVSKDDYLALLMKSGNKCMICGSLPGKKALNIDHCHSTGEVRGLLCHGCNTAIGHMREDITMLESAIKYLTEARKGKK